MRNILHAKFGDQLAKQSRTSDKAPRTGLGPQLPSKPVEELEAALTKARDAWVQAEDEPGLSRSGISLNFRDDA